MKTEPSKTIREVWAAKEAAQAETEKLKSPGAFFGHLRKCNPDLGLPRIHMLMRRNTRRG